MSPHDTPQPADEQILEVVFEGIDEGAAPSLEELFKQFPGRADAVRRALKAAGNYQAAIERERHLHGAAAGAGVLSEGTILGDFTILGELGHGGMGVVYRARQASLGGREVALKVLPPAMVARSPRFMDRFRREAALAATVHHANLAEVYGSGAEDGVPYFAMRLIEGRTLLNVLCSLAEARRMGGKSHQAPTYIRRVVRLVQGVANALAAIHEQGLIHRDVKPSNILLENSGSDSLGALEQRPVLVDFGLLRPVESTDITGPDTTLYTPAYASPESKLQRDLGPGSDVFSLGTVLYDLLAQTTTDDRQTASSGLPNIRTMNPGVDERLAAIVRMALEDSPALRYSDGAALARELDCYLDGAGIHALPTGTFRRARLWARRHPSRAVKLGLFILAILPVFAFTGVLGTRAMDLYTLARVARELEAGDRLVEASAAYEELLEHEERAAYLPGIGDDLARGHDYWPDGPGVLGTDPTIRLACAELGEASEDAQRRGYITLQRVLIGEDAATWTPPIYRFLTKEIRGDFDGLDAASKRKRRLDATETIAHHYTRRPTNYQESLSLPPATHELKHALLSILANPDEPPALRALACAAISGMTDLESYEALAGIVCEISSTESCEHGNELTRVAVASISRLWWQFRLEGAILVLPQSLLAELGASVHAIGIKCRGHVGYSDMNVFEEVLAQIAISSRLHRLGGAYRRPEWRYGTQAGQDFLAELERYFSAHHAGQSPPPVSEKFNPSSSFGDPDSELRRIKFDSTWRIPTNIYACYVDLLTVPPDSRKTQFSVGSRLFSALEVDGGSESVSKLPFVATSEYTTVLQMGSVNVMEFQTIQHSVLRFRTELPQRKAEFFAYITLDHCKPARWYLPQRGRVRIRVLLEGGRLLHEGEVSLGRSKLEFAVTNDELAQMSDLAFEVRMIDGTAAYWLYGLHVEFGPWGG